MPRQRRIECQGAIYHVLSRRDRPQAILLGDADRHDSLKTPAGTCQKAGFQVHACCWMKNHFHRVVETAMGAQPGTMTAPSSPAGSSVPAKAVVAWALMEGAGVCGLVLTLLSGPGLWLIGLSFVVMLLHPPKRSWFGMS